MLLSLSIPSFEFLPSIPSGQFSNRVTKDITIHNRFLRFPVKSSTHISLSFGSRVMLPMMRCMITICFILSSLTTFNSFHFHGKNERNGKWMTHENPMVRNSLYRRGSGMFANEDSAVFVEPVEELDISTEPVDADITEIMQSAPNRQLVWNAAVKSSVRVKELGRSCEEYMRLPATECKTNITSISHPLFRFLLI